MSDPMDDKTLPEYLARDSEISRRYRELGVDEVPSELDRRVLEMAGAAATRNAGTVDAAWFSRRKQRLLRWGAPLAVAASAVLVLSIVIESGVQQEAAPVGTPAKVSNAQLSDSEVTDRAVRERRNAAPEASGLVNAPYFVAPQAPVESDADVHKEVTVTAQRVQESLQTTPSPVAALSDVDAPTPRAIAAPSPAAPVPPAARTDETTVSATASNRTSPAEASPSRELDEIAVTGSRARRESQRTVGPRGTIRARAAAESGPESAESATYPDPEEWLTAIRKLREDGRSSEADGEWERFRKAHPDFGVEESDPARPEADN